MASVFAYFRPRGVPGNYKIGILLEQGSPSEQVNVVYIPPGGTFDIPGNLVGSKLFYTQTAIKAGWSVVVEIRDKDIAYPQQIRYIPTQDNIQEELVNDGYTSSVMFHEIILVDLDELTKAARHGKIHELEYMPEVAEVRQLLQRD